MDQLITSLASSITRTASKQTYYTIRFLVDRDRVEDAYRAYGYFRWVDDTLDAAPGSGSFPTEAEACERRTFLKRQMALLESSYSGETPRDIIPQEQMLVDLVQHDHEKQSGLGAYLRNMMLVMDFDARRRGRLITQAELNQYTRWLAVAVTENLHTFIGHGEYAPRDETRYMAVSAAHIAHMLRDTFDDVQAGYYNIPREILEADHIGPEDVHHPAYRRWVQNRVALARQYFKAGRAYFKRVQNPRCRLACFAYIARFDWLLETLEREDCNLRAEYGERKRLSTGLRMAWHALACTINLRRPVDQVQPVAAQRAGRS